MPAAAAQPQRAVLVTVGSTKFDALIRAVDDERVADALSAQGYDALIMQARDCITCQCFCWSRNPARPHAVPCHATPCQNCYMFTSIWINRQR